MQKRSWAFVAVLFVAAAGFSPGCKSLFSKSDLERQAEKLSIDCAQNPPIRTDFRDDLKTIESQGPIDASGKPCGEIASDPKLKLSSVRTGKWTNYHPDGVKVQSTGEFLKNRKTGEWITWFPGGYLSKRQFFADHKLDGAETTYFDQPGEVWRTQGSYRQGKKNGRWQERLSVDASCITEGSYDNGKKSGRWRECQKDPQTQNIYLAFDGSYEGDLRSGAAKFYYPNGVLQMDCAFKADHPCVSKTRDELEKKKAKDPKSIVDLDDPKNYQGCSKPKGRWVLYHDTGSKYSEGAFDNEGRRQGIWTENYKNGSLAATGDYAAGKKKGFWVFYEKDGTKVVGVEFQPNGLIPKAIQIFEGNRVTGTGDAILGSIKYDMEKDVLERRAFQRNGMWVEYHSDGRKSGEGEYSMDKRRGPWKFYDGAGNVTSEGAFSMGEKQGVWREQVNGQMTETKYFMGKPQKSKF